MIDQSLKGRIFVNAQDNQFVQCVSPSGVDFPPALLPWALRLWGSCDVKKN